MKCERSLPAADEHFRRSLNGRFASPCKGCLHEARRWLHAQTAGREPADRTLAANHVRCAVCAEPLVQITGSHLAKHGITMREYRARFPDQPTASSVCAELMRARSQAMWADRKDELSAIRARVAPRGPAHRNWRGGYDAGVTGGSPKSRARRRAIRLYGHACMIPGCTFDIVVDNHHIVPRAEGGGHEAENCIVLCPNHHAMADLGLLTRAELSTIVRHRLGQ